MVKNIVVSGSSRGIGLELVKYFSNLGHQVLALSRNTQPIEALKLSGVRSLSVDLADEQTPTLVAQQVQAHWDHVDVLINNAGLLINKPFAALSRDDFNQVYQVNIIGLAALTQSLLPFMGKNGHVVSISSMGGIQGSVKFPGLAAYSSSKAAVLTLTELLAEEYKETGPCFNALALGAVQTEMLQEAFPGLKVSTTAEAMASYIGHFSLTAQQFYNGKLLQVSNSTP